MVEAAAVELPALTPEVRAALRDLVREVFRTEIQAALPHLRAGPALLSIPECAKKYRRGYDTIRRMADRGELASIKKPHRGGGGMATWIVAADAARVLGGVL